MSGEWPQGPAAFGYPERVRVWILILAVIVAFSHSLCAAGCVSKQPDHKVDQKVPPCHQQAPTVEACPYQADADRTMDKASLEPLSIVVAEAVVLPAWRPVTRQEPDEPEVPPPPSRRLTPLRI
jgi:hypothetical protein